MRNFGKRREIDINHDFRALMFALFGLTAPFAVVGFLVTIWMVMF